MDDYDWNEIKERMMKLTLRQLRPVLRWFTLGYASTKGDKVSIAVSQLRYWVHYNGKDGRARAWNVMRELEKAEGARG